MSTPNAPAASSPAMTTADKLFVSFLVLMVAAVTWLGVLNYKEGLKTEGAKRNGETWMAWLAEAGQHRGEANFAHKACASGIKSAVAGTKDEPAEGTWGACVKYLMSQTELKDLVNPFTGKPPQFVAACVPSDRSLVGGLLLEDLAPTPPGSPVPFVASQLVDEDPIDKKIQVRITICDKGSDAVKIGEVEF
jgi:hypothetical protein